MRHQVEHRLRVGTAAAAQDQAGPARQEAAQGLLHESFGLATFALGTLALIGVSKVLR